jgi:hypothetical protein
MWGGERKLRGTRDQDALGEIEDRGIEKREKRGGRVKDQSVVRAEFFFFSLVLRLPALAKHDDMTIFLVNCDAYSFPLLIQGHIELLSPSTFGLFLSFFTLSS